MTRPEAMNYDEKLIEFKKNYLKEVLEKCTEEEQKFFKEKIFPYGVPDSQLESSIKLIERSLRKENKSALEYWKQSLA